MARKKKRITDEVDRTFGARHGDLLADFTFRRPRDYQVQRTSVPNRQQSLPKGRRKESCAAVGSRWGYGHQGSGRVRETTSRTAAGASEGSACSFSCEWQNAGCTSPLDNDLRLARTIKSTNEAQSHGARRRPSAGTRGRRV